MTTSLPVVLTRLDGLRTELADLAFMLERRGRRDAADLAVTISARIGELCTELGGPGVKSCPSEQRLKP